jgi:hypothetical protein
MKLKSISPKALEINSLQLITYKVCIKHNFKRKELDYSGALDWS